MKIRTSSRAVILSLLVSALAAPQAAAAPQAPGAAGRARSTVIDARVPLLFEHRNRSGKTLPFYIASRSFEASGRAPLLVRFAREVTEAERTAYAALGVSFGRRLASGATKVV